MIYLVSSLHRSGSSMAMRCLEAGGLDAAYDDTHAALNERYARPGYVPNPHGFYALNYARLLQPDFGAAYDGRLVKCYWRALPRLPRHAYRLLWMRRDGDEIVASMDAFMPQGFLCDRTAVRVWPVIGPLFFAALAARGDMEIVTLDYAAVVADPVRAFGRLGWPVDEYAAADMVEPALYRQRVH